MTLLRRCPRTALPRLATPSVGERLPQAVGAATVGGELASACPLMA